MLMGPILADEACGRGALSTIGCGRVGENSDELCTAAARLWRWLWVVELRRRSSAKRVARSPRTGQEWCARRSDASTNRKLNALAGAHSRRVGRVTGRRSSADRFMVVGSVTPSSTTWAPESADPGAHVDFWTRSGRRVPDGLRCHALSQTPRTTCDERDLWAWPAGVGVLMFAHLAGRFLDALGVHSIHRQQVAQDEFNSVAKIRSAAARPAYVRSS